uniref:Ig-like domain-containing protein n=1 Tax=Monodelphis domestica TaxID=13616 RepID=F7DAN1_MONDO
MQGLLAAQTQKQNKNRQQSPNPSHSGSRSQSWSHSHRASPSPSPPRTHNRTAHCSNHHSSSHNGPLNHSHHSRNTNHHPSNTCPTRRKATGLAKRKAKKGRSPYRREKQADRRAPALKRKIPVLWSRESSLHRDRDRLCGNHTAFSLESSRDSSRETPTEETPCWSGEQRFLGRREAVTSSGQCRPMERPSEASQSRGSTWKGLLIITASILSCWSQPTSAQDLPVVPEPAYGKEGDNVTLVVRGFSGTPLSYTWYTKLSAEDPKDTEMVMYSVINGSQTPNDIRQRVFPNGSLLIPNLVLNDTKYYTVQMVDTIGNILRGGAQLTVYENLMKPNITINSASNIMENDTVVLTCNTENGNNVGTRWYFKNEKLILNDRMNLSQDNKTLTIMPVKGEDNGDYQCEIWNPIGTNRSDSFHLVVIYGPEEIKLYPNSVNGQIEVTFNENLTLGCEAKSQPPAQYTWQINGSSISGNSGNNYTIYQASWKHEGIYTCMAVNNVTKATISTQNTVKVVEKMDPSGGGSSLSGGAIAGIVIGVLAGVALIGALVYCLFFRKSAGASDHHPTEHKSSAPNHSHLKSDRPPNGTEEVSYASVNFNAQKSSATVQAPTPTETIYSEIKKK